MSCWWPGTILEAGIFYIIFFIIILNTWRLCEWGFKLVLRCLIENKWPYVMRCAIWTHLYNLKNVKNTHRGVLILVKLQASACTFTKINTLPWVFFAFFKLYKCEQIAHRITFKKNFLCWVTFKMLTVGEGLFTKPVYSVLTNVINLCGEIQIRKSRHYGGQAM